MRTNFKNIEMTFINSDLFKASLKISKSYGVVFSGNNTLWGNFSKRTKTNNTTFVGG